MSATSPYGPGFVPLSPTAFLRIPPEGTKPSGRCIAKEPALIVVTTWLDAAPKHITRYLRGLQLLFPTSRMLLVITTAKHFLFQPTRQRLAELQPAIEVLKQLQPNERALLHSFSNAGATTAWQLARAHRRQTGSSLPFSKIVFDSAPGRSGFSSSLAAFSVGLPASPLIRTPCLALLCALFAVWYVVERLTFTTNILDLMRAGLNDRELFATRAARLYVYSAQDRLVPSHDVEEHAREAEGRKYAVRRLCYVDTAHVAHLLGNEPRYWAAVEALWDSDYLSGPGLVVNAW